MAIGPTLAYIRSSPPADIIYESCRSNPQGPSNDRRSGDASDRLKRAGIYDLEILQSYAGSVRNPRAAAPCCFLSIDDAGIEGCRHVAQRIIERRRDPPLPFVEPLIARAECQPIGLSHRGHANDAHWDVEVEIGRAHV